MQSVEDFMRAYFCARSAQLQREEEGRKPFRQKFFLPDCSWSSRQGAVAQSASEAVESVSLSGHEARVTTRQDHVIPRKRYKLVQSSKSWLIHCVETPCRACQGQTNNPLCERCQGTGWVDLFKPSSAIPQGRNRPPDRTF